MQAFLLQFFSFELPRQAVTIQALLTELLILVRLMPWLQPLPFKSFFTLHLQRSSLSPPLILISQLVLLSLAQLKPLA